MQAKQTFKLPVGEWVMLHSCRLTHPKDSADLTTNMEKFLEFERRQKKRFELAGDHKGGSYGRMESETCGASFHVMITVQEHHRL